MTTQTQYHPRDCKLCVVRTDANKMTCGTMLSILDAVTPDGKTYWGKVDAEEYAKEHGGRVMDFDEAMEIKRRAFLAPPTLITKQRFVDALECLPPCNWVQGQGCESFAMIERTFSDITTIYCRIGDRYFELSDSISTPHHEIVKRCQAAYSSHDDEPVYIGSLVANIESGWTGRVYETANVQGDPMLVCYHQCGSKLERDDKQWFGARDVKVVGEPRHCDFW